MRDSELRNILKVVCSPRDKFAFIRRIVNKTGHTRLLDIGCGNNSGAVTKKAAPNVYYVGLDVGDYNQSGESVEMMDEYIVVPPDKFAEKVESLKEFDFVISAHNIEHCCEAERVLRAIPNCLKRGGYLFLAFPCEESVNFPPREGTLNFYDDETHIYMPKFDQVIQGLKDSGMTICFQERRYRPLPWRVRGWLNEGKSKRLKKILPGTLDYYGFQSIVWARKD